MNRPKASNESLPRTLVSVTDHWLTRTMSLRFTSTLGRFARQRVQWGVRGISAVSGGAGSSGKSRAPLGALVGGATVSLPSRQSI